ncbi:ACT domain-containing protein [Bisporella sp. PMI_857]|nr:ACT domain-containing protein [Bisporella sp. PMI_857]
MPSTGETSLSTLIRSMEPILSPTRYVYLSIPNSSPIARDAAALQPVVTVREDEGLTMVLEQDIADANKLEYSYVAALISLKVHSALEAVGLTAAFATALMEKGISANVVAGFYHDHLYVAWDDREKALEALKELSMTVGS